MTRQELSALAERLFARARSRSVGADYAAAARDDFLAARLARGLSREPGGDVLATRILSAPAEVKATAASPEGAALITAGRRYE
jgi:hypothetical protein